MGLEDLKFKNAIFSFLILSIALTSSILFFEWIQEVEGAPAVGSKEPKSYGSKNAGLVCGDRLCSEDERTSLPKITEEEISKNTQRFLEIKGDPVTNGTINYQIVVSGQISLGPKANPADRISTDGTTIDGNVLPKGLDNYYFTGDIISITADQNVFSFVDGVEVTTQIVPEFGTIAVIVLGFTMFSIILVTSRSKVIPRL